MISKPLREQAYEYLQSQLLNGSLRAGSVISEQCVADEIGISRTPVREAIGLLEREGLVERVRFTTVVRSPSLRDLRELYEMREALECMAAEAAASGLSPESLDLLTRAYEEMDRVAREMNALGLDYLTGPLLQRYLDADITFHMLIVRGTDNRRCMKLISEFRVIQRIFEYHSVVHTPRLVGEAREQHGKILEAIRQGDGQAARDRMSAHIRGCQGYALSSLDRGGSGDTSAEEYAPDLPADLWERLDRPRSIETAI